MSRPENPEILKAHTVNYLLARRNTLGTRPEAQDPPLPGLLRRPKSYQRRAALAASEIIRIVEAPVRGFLVQRPDTKGRERRRLLREALEAGARVVHTYKPPHLRPVQPPLRPTPEMRTSVSPAPPGESAPSQVVDTPQDAQSRTRNKVRKAMRRFREDSSHRNKVIFRVGKTVISGASAAITHNPVPIAKSVWGGFQSVREFLQDNPVPRDLSIPDQIFFALDRAWMLDDNALKQITQRRRLRR
jgi:hypothetical protein